MTLTILQDTLMKVEDVRVDTDSIIPLKTWQFINGLFRNVVRSTLDCYKVQRSQKDTHCYVRSISGIINNLMIISLEQELDISDCFFSKTFK
jgi:hypothetical protein